MTGYGDDLAYIHDAGHSDYALNAAPGLLRILKSHGVCSGLIVDLGCGSGRWARELNRAGYHVLGIDQSAAMLRLARRVAPESRFRRASLLRVKLPECDGITSMGECLNYCFDPNSGRRALASLFRRAYRALRPGGVFAFDIAGPARAPAGEPRKYWSAGADWAVLSTASAHGEDLLRRHIISFRRVGNRYRRTEETHDLRLYRAEDLASELTRCGFHARTLAGYGRFRFPPGISGIVAVKPRAGRP